MIEIVTGVFKDYEEYRSSELFKKHKLSIRGLVVVYLRQYKELTYKDIAIKLGVSTMRVKQLEQVAMRHIAYILFHNNENRAFMEEYYQTNMNPRKTDK